MSLRTALNRSPTPSYPTATLSTTRPFSRLAPPATANTAFRTASVSSVGFKSSSSRQSSLHHLPRRNFNTSSRLKAGDPGSSNMSGTEGKQGVHNLQAKKDFDEALAVKDTLMVLDCFATWCGPCKVIAPTIVKYSDDFPNARFYKIDVDEVPDVAQELGIRAMPTFMFFKNGEKVQEVVGANANAIKAAIESNL